MPSLRKIKGADFLEIENSPCMLTDEFLLKKCKSNKMWFLFGSSRFHEINKIMMKYITKSHHIRKNYLMTNYNYPNGEDKFDYQIYTQPLSSFLYY